MANEEVQNLTAQQAAVEIADITRRSVERDLPVFLLVIYRSEVEKLDFFEALGEELAERDLRPRIFDLYQHPGQGTGKLYARLQEVGDDVLSLVTGLPRHARGFGLDPDFLQYLNLHRDRIGRRRLRLVLLLHESDMDQFMRQAGDLWSVRQHTWWLERKPQWPGGGTWIPLPLPITPAPLEDRDQGRVRKHIQQVRGMVEEVRQPEDRVRLLLNLSTWLLRRDLADQAAEVALEALELLPPVADRSLEPALRKAAGEALARLGREEEALEHLEGSRVLFGQMHPSRAQAEVLETLGHLHRSQGRPERALDCFRESLDLYQEVGPEDRVARVKSDLAMLHYERADYPAAVELLESAVELFRETRSPGSMMVALERLAHVLQAQGYPEQAVYPLTVALSYAEPDLGDEISIQGEPEEESRKAALRNDLALVYGDLGRFEAALQEAEHSRAIYRVLEDARGEAIVSWSLVRLFEARGWLERAVEVARRAVDIESRIGHPDLDRHQAHLADLEHRLEEEKALTASRVAEPEPPTYEA